MTWQNSTRETSQPLPLILLWSMGLPNRTSATVLWKSKCTCFTLAKLGLACFFASLVSISKFGANVSDWRSLTPREVEKVKLGLYLTR